MNKSVKFAISMVAVMSATTAYAVGSVIPARTGKVVSTKTKEKNKNKEVPVVDAAKFTGNKQAILESRFAEVLEGRFGADVTRILGQELTNIVKVQGKDGKEVIFEHEVKTNEIAEFILTKMEKEGNGEIKKHLEISANFLGMSKNLSISGSQEYGAYVKQLALIPEMFQKMSPTDRATHIDVMANALAKLKQNPELTADIAYSLALKERYKGDYAQKLLDILGCKG